MKRLLVLFIVLYCYLCNAQNYVYFNNLYDFFGEWEVAWNVQKVDSGYYVVGGVGDSITGLSCIGILLIDTTGNEIWKKSYCKNNITYYGGVAGSFIKTYDGGFALGGNISYPNGDSDAMLWRFDENGDTLWTKIFKDTNSLAVAYNCIQTRDNGFALVGYSDAGSNTAMLMKTDSMGNEEWTKTYNGFAIMSVDTCFDGGFILGSDIYSNDNWNPYIIKTDSLGNLQWNRTFGGPYNENCLMVKATSDGGYICAGDTGHFDSGTWIFKQLYLIKLDSSGNVEWKRGYGSVYPATTLTSVIELPDGSFIAAGQGCAPISLPSTPISGVILKVNAQGDSLWMRYYRKYSGSLCAGSDNYLRDIQQTNDSGYIVAGFVSSFLVPVGTQDMWVMKLDSLGLCNDNAICYDTLISCNYMDPHFSYTTDNLTASFFNILNECNKDIYKWYWDFGDGTITNITEYYFPAIDTITHTYDSSGTYTVMMIVTDCYSLYSPYSCCIDTAYETITITTGIDNINNNTVFLSNYPNPFSDYTIIKAFVPEDLNNAELVIYDLLGVVIKKYPLEKGYNAVTVLSDELPSNGIYLYSLISGARRLAVGKMTIIK